MKEPSKPYNYLARPFFHKQMNEPSKDNLVANSEHPERISVKGRIDKIVAVKGNGENVDVNSDNLLSDESSPIKTWTRIEINATTNIENNMEKFIKADDLLDALQIRIDSINDVFGRRNIKSDSEYKFWKGILWALEELQKYLKPSGDVKK